MIASTKSGTLTLKTRSHKRLALLTFALLLLGLGLSCFVWVRKEQRQYGLDRALIAALEANDAEQAIRLVNAGADPNTTYAPPPSPSLNDLWQFWQHPKSETIAIPNPTAIRIACGARWLQYIDSNFFNPSGHFHPRKGEAVQLVEAMLQHGADPDLGPKGSTPLQIAQQQHNAALVVLLQKYRKQQK